MTPSFRTRKLIITSRAIEVEVKTITLNRSSRYISQHLEVDPPTEVAGNGGPDVGALVRQHRLQVPVAARDEGEPRADHGLCGEPRVEVGEDRLEGVLAGDRVLRDARELRAEDGEEGVSDGPHVAVEGALDLERFAAYL